MSLWNYNCIIILMAMDMVRVWGGGGRGPNFLNYELCWNVPKKVHNSCIEGCYYIFKHWLRSKYVNVKVNKKRKNQITTNVMFRDKNGRRRTYMSEQPFFLGYCATTHLTGLSSDPLTLELNGDWLHSNNWEG